jgi:hypothetical protein
MNSTSLHALIIDQHFGELSPEAAELLEAHLAQDASARAEADRIRQTLAVTGEAVVQHPELAQAEPEDVSEKRDALRHRFPDASWLAKAAAIAAFASLTWTVGFWSGKKQDVASPGPASMIATATQQPPRTDRPWARYRIASASHGLQVVRVDNITRQ